MVVPQKFLREGATFDCHNKTKRRRSKRDDVIIDLPPRNKNVHE
jgi:hypothetical protein